MSMPYPKDTSEDGVSQSINLKINVQVLGAEGDQGYQPPTNHQPTANQPPTNRQPTTAKPPQKCHQTTHNI